MIDFIRYTLDLPHKINAPPAEPQRNGRKESTVEPQVIDAWLLLSSAFLRSFATFAFTLALNHQRVNRSKCEIAAVYISLYLIADL